MTPRNESKRHVTASPAQAQAHGTKAQSRHHTQIGGFFPSDLRSSCELRPLTRNHHDRAAAMRCLSRKTGEFGLIQF